ncbi:MAG: phosphatase PAP2 family protein [Gemmatimonadales bacterium]
MGLGSILLTVLAEGIGHLALPNDRLFEAVLYLMWSSDSSQQVFIKVLFDALIASCIVLACVVLWAAAIWKRPWSPGTSRLVERAYRYAFALPGFVLAAMHLGRFVANLLYSVTPLALWDLSPLLVNLEGPLLLWMQRTIASPALSSIASFLYSIAWVVAVSIFGPALVFLDQRRAVDEALLGTALLSVLSLPLFVLLPVFDPWALNPTYGYGGSGQIGVLYLYPGSSLPILQNIVTELRWATGACLPSLHVAFPLLFGLVARRARLRKLWLCYGAFAAITGVVVVYLGRHWVIDVVAAIPASYGALWLVGRLPWRLTLDLPHRV